MFSRLLGGYYKRRLHAKKDQFIGETVAAFRKRHGFDENDKHVKELKERLEQEAIRVYEIVDESILKERLKLIERTFFITAAAMFLLTFLLVGFASPLAMLMPFAAAGVAAYVSIDTIDISYNQRVIGAFKSVAAVYEEELSQAKAKAAAMAEIRPPVLAERNENIAGGFVKRLENERKRFIPSMVPEVIVGA